ELRQPEPHRPIVLGRGPFGPLRRLVRATDGLPDDLSGPGASAGPLAPKLSEVPVEVVEFPGRPPDAQLRYPLEGLDLRVERFVGPAESRHGAIRRRSAPSGAGSRSR